MSAVEVQVGADCYLPPLRFYFVFCFVFWFEAGELGGGEATVWYRTHGLLAVRR